MNTRILLADDHQLFRDGLRAMLEKEGDLEVVAEAEDGRAAVQQARELKPDLVVMDVSMPNLNGMEATRQVARQAPKAKILALSMHSDRRFIEGMLKAGAHGYLLKDCANEEFIRAIRAVVSGQTYLSPAVTGDVIKGYLKKKRPTASERSDILTAREREVLQLVAEGLMTKEIARRLSISVKTSETHRQHVMNKLDIHNVAELTKFAVREGLTSLED